MSRFYEALQKARQEKAANEEPALPTVDEIIAAEPATLSINGMAAVEASSVAASGVTGASLLQKCSHQRWNPNPAQILATSGDAGLVGVEKFRTLRSRLYQLRETRPLSVIAVSSALPDEGKTFVAANLAYVFAKQHERRVLLIDADLRHSTLPNLLGAPSSPGLADYISSRARLEEVIHRGDKDNLFFLPTGKLDPNPGELIASVKMQQLIEQLRPLFDWVIIDSPPVIPVSDASILADLCDGVLLVVRAGSTDVRLATRAKSEFKREALLGVVLNRATEVHRGYPDMYGYNISGS
jgi:capsular exopolysaccharide synthesis family protein